MRHSQTFTPIRSQAWEKSSFPELPTAEAKWSPRDGLHTPANSIRAAKKSSTSHHCHHGRSVGHETQCLNTPGLSIGAPNLSLFRRSSERMKKSGPEKGFGPNTTSIQGREACISHQRAPRIITQHINVQKAPYDTSVAPRIITMGSRVVQLPHRRVSTWYRAMRCKLRMLIFPIFYIRQQKISPHLK